MTDIGQRYRRLRSEVPAHVAIVAVSKLQPASAVSRAIDAGARDFGENYVQEAVRKFAAMQGVTKHFIGHVQTNKAKAIAAAFDLVQSVDRLDAALALSKAAAHLGKVLPVLLQINISPGERFGISPQEAPQLAQRIREMENLRLDGVMAIGPVGVDRAQVQAAFERAARTWTKVGGTVLSIGMSGDWREAVAAGSTMIRAGSAIFGPRAAKDTSKHAPGQVPEEAEERT